MSMVSARGGGRVGSRWERGHTGVLVVHTSHSRELRFYSGSDGKPLEGFTPVRDVMQFVSLFY